MKTLSSLFILIFSTSLFAVPGKAKPLPIGSSTKVIFDFSAALNKTYEGIYRRNVAAYSDKCVHRPNSELPNDCVSEGIGYGMILALYSNDQEGFNAIWDAGERLMWSGTSYHWRVNETGKIIGTGPATDAEIDIAAMLIFADRLVQKGTWISFTSSEGADYSTRAQTILDGLWSGGIDNNILLPGYYWGTGSFWNPGYFAPAFFRVFADFDSNPIHKWMDVIDACYTAIENNPGYSLGLIPDWAQHNGKLTPAGPGYNAFLKGDSFYKDAIRALWRIGTDYAWNKDPRAKTYLENAIQFIGTAENANFFNIDGTLYDNDLTFTLGNNITRPRKEHSHLTIGQWISTVTATNDSSYIADFIKELDSFYEPEADYWGLSDDPINEEDTLHNEMYFDQFLAWFGASLVSGKFQNVYADIDLAIDHKDIDNRFTNLLDSPTYNLKLDPTNSPLHYELYNISGQFLKRSHSKIDIKTLDLPLGIYHLITKNQKRSIYKKEKLTIY